MFKTMKYVFRNAYKAVVEAERFGVEQISLGWLPMEKMFVLGKLCPQEVAILTEAIRKEIARDYFQQKISFSTGSRSCFDYIYKSESFFKRSEIASAVQYAGLVKKNSTFVAYNSVGPVLTDLLRKKYIIRIGRPGKGLYRVNKGMLFTS